MKKLYGIIMGLLLVFLVVGSAGAIELIINGDFENETDHSYGWETTGDVDFTNDFSWLAEYQGLNGYYARLGLDTTNSDSLLSQTFSVSGINELTVSFDWAFDYWDDSYTAEDNFISILKSDGSTAFSITMQDLKTQGTFWNPSLELAYGTFTNVYDISSYTANNANVEFKLHEESSPWYDGGTASVAAIDNVSITGQPVPEPASMVLFGLGLVGIAGVTRKRLRK